MTADARLTIRSPDAPEHEAFSDAAAAVERLIELYDLSVRFLCDRFADVMSTGMPSNRFRAFYPEIRLTTTTFSHMDTRLSFGHVAEPGRYSTTVTRPKLFANYLRQQIDLLIRNHGMPIQVGMSQTAMPVHFAVANDAALSVPQEGATDYTLRDVFDVPDLATMHDDIVNGYGFTHTDGSHPLAPFTAQRVDYSLARLSHYTATEPAHFQNHVLFTNYQFYVEEF